MGMIFKNVKVKELGFNRDYIDGPMVITPKPIDINSNMYYVGIQSSFSESGYYNEYGIKGAKIKIPTLYFWLLDSPISDGYIMKESDSEYDNITKIGEQISTVILTKLYFGLFDKEKYDNKIKQDKEFAKKCNIYYDKQSYADIFRHEICNDCSITINKNIIIQILENFKEDEINNIYNILGRVE